MTATQVAVFMISHRIAIATWVTSSNSQLSDEGAALLQLTQILGVGIGGILLAITYALVLLLSGAGLARLIGTATELTGRSTSNTRALGFVISWALVPLLTIALFAWGLASTAFQ
jgi:hypothetical protein